jgi:hypothetical protein
LRKLKVNVSEKKNYVISNTFRILHGKPDNPLIFGTTLKFLGLFVTLLGTV